MGENKWVGTNAWDISRFKLWYSRGMRGKNGLRILVNRELRELVVEVRRMNDKLMAIKVVIGGLTLNVISAYTPQVGLDKEIKRCF